MRNDKEFLVKLKDLHLKGELNHNLMRAIEVIKWHKSRRNKINWSYDINRSANENKILIRQQKAKEILRLYGHYIPFDYLSNK